MTGIDPEELSKSLHSGQIPQAYEAVISEIQVKEVRKFVKEVEKLNPYMEHRRK